MATFVGVDAGGTHARAVAANRDEIVGEYSGPCSNLRSTDVDTVADAIARAVAGALHGARAAGVCVGAAGAGNEDIARALREALQSRLPGVAVDVTIDARIALRAAIPAGDGMALIAGTGSIAYASAGGSYVRCGGYGHALGDEGSAYAIGAAALRTALRSYDGRAPRDAFVEAIEVAFGACGARELLERPRASGHPVAAIAALAVRVLELANDGDRTATKIVQSAALDLFELIKALAKTTGLAGSDFPLAFAGGLLAQNSLLTYLIETRIASEFPLASVLKGSPAPQFGALALARTLAAG